MKSAFQKWQCIKLSALHLSQALLYFPISKNIFIVQCTLCTVFLCTEKPLQTKLLDRGSLKYPSSYVLECVKVIFDIFSKIDCNKAQFDKFYSSSSRTKLVNLACTTIELELNTL